MAEFEEKLNAILSDPEAMGQIVSIAKALTGGSAPDSSSAPSSPEEAASRPPEDAAPSPAAPETLEAGPPDLSALLLLAGSLSGGGSDPLSAPGGLDPAMVQKALRLFSEYSAADDRKIALLTALKPFLKEERLAKVDKAVQIARLSRVIRVAFQLFQKEGNGDGAL